MKLLSSERADAEVVGHVIILGVAILGISMIMLYGVPAIQNLEDTANIKNVEQAFTVLDSRASRAILGESPLQITNINLGGGSLTSEPNSTGEDKESYIVIRSNNTFYFKIPMGKIVYQAGDREVAYEGGGVWAKYPSGASVMLSPPEFHYAGVTLTVPVINITGSSSAGGKGMSSVYLASGKTPIIEFPNTTCTNCTNRTNPVNFTQVGRVYVDIVSDFYDAWADYARMLVFTRVKENSTARTAGIELIVVPAYLKSKTSLTDPIIFRGMNMSDQTPLDNFSFVLKGVESDFNWQLTAVSENKTLIFYLKKSGGPGDFLDLSIGYKNFPGSYDESDSAEVWKKEKAFPVVSGEAEVDLLNQSMNLEYDRDTVGSESGTCTKKINNLDFNDTDFSWDNILIEEGVPPNNTQSLYNITQHYIWLMGQPDGEISFDQCTPGGAHAPASGSKMLIDYDAPGGLTYLHISRNDLDVSIS